MIILEIPSCKKDIKHFLEFKNMNQDQTQWILQFVIEKDKIAQFKELIQAASKAVERGEIGAMRYCWYFNDQETECIVTEEYENSKAGISHLNGVAIGEFLPQLQKISKVTRFEVFGNPNKELEDMLRKFGPKFFHVFAGFTR